MIRDVHAHFELLTPKDLRGHTCRVGRVDITDEHGHTKKNFFEPKGYFWTFSQKNFFDVQRAIWVLTDPISVADYHGDLFQQMSSRI